MREDVRCDEDIRIHVGKEERAGAEKAIAARNFDVEAGEIAKSTRRIHHGDSLQWRWR